MKLSSKDAQILQIIVQYCSSIDMNAVWDMAHDDIPPLRAYCADLLKANNCEIIRIKQIPKK